MGIFGRMKRAVKSKANAAVDKAIDPAKEIQMAIHELEQQHKAALTDLLAYKASAKSIEKDMATLEEKTRTWEQRAIGAVRKGDDALARECLREKKTCAAELERLRRDRDEATGYAVELNRSRKEVETRLKIFKLKKGTMATQIAVARSGTGNAFGFSNDVFDRMDRAEERIDGDAIEAEVSAAMEGEDSGSALEARILAASRAEPVVTAADDALDDLKAKMASDREQLKKGP